MESLKPSEHLHHLTDYMILKKKETAHSINGTWTGYPIHRPNIKIKTGSKYIIGSHVNVKL